MQVLIHNWPLAGAALCGVALVVNKAREVYRQHRADKAAAAAGEASA